MYSTIKLSAKYIRYKLTASNSRGHNVHSPFVFEFITQVLNDDRIYYCFQAIEQVRSQLKIDNRLLELEDFGAGSRIDASYKRKVQSIAAGSLKPRKFARLLFRMVLFYKPSNILELGTSLGITAAYLASANIQTPVTTMEGAKEVAKIAAENFKKLQLKNITVIQGNFDNTLQQVTASNTAGLDFVFLDGNHRKEPTIRYFEQLLPGTHEHSILIFDDIHWSKEMEEAWQQIKAHPAVTLTVDLFFIGIVFFRKEQIIKQHFTVRF